MYIKEISLSDFRNIQETTVKLNKGINIFYGSNANGKTNFLESIYLCSTGRSHRTKNDKEMVRFGVSQAHVKLFLKNKSTIWRIDAHIHRNDKKGIAINGIPLKKSSELFGTLYTVIFSPEDLQLIKDAPSRRRRFVDIELCQISKVYCHTLQQYMKVLKQRNNLLKEIQKNSSLKETLFAWDMQLAEYGKRIISFRKEFINNVSIKAAARHKQISSGNEELSVVYVPSAEENDFEIKLQSTLERDIFMGSTSYGPHRDDISFFINGNDVRIYGSQGQQRTAAICAKLAEIDIIKENTDTSPVLLLDDVLSELDKTRQHMLMDCINDVQTIITCTGIEDSITNYAGNAAIFNVNNGVIKREIT